MKANRFGFLREKHCTGHGESMLSKREAHHELIPLIFEVILSCKYISSVLSILCENDFIIITLCTASKSRRRNASYDGDDDNFISVHTWRRVDMLSATFSIQAAYASRKAINTLTGMPSRLSFDFLGPYGLHMPCRRRRYFDDVDARARINAIGQGALNTRQIMTMYNASISTHII